MAARMHHPRVCCTDLKHSCFAVYFSIIVVEPDNNFAANCSCLSAQWYSCTVVVGRFAIGQFSCLSLCLCCSGRLLLLLRVVQCIIVSFSNRPRRSQSMTTLPLRPQTDSWWVTISCFDRSSTASCAIGNCFGHIDLDYRFTDTVADSYLDCSCTFEAMAV